VKRDNGLHRVFPGRTRFESILLLYTRHATVEVVDGMPSRRLLALATAAALSITLVPVPTITVNDGNATFVLLLLHPLNAGIRFIHSSELTPWAENWTVDPLKGVIVKSICISSEGAGQPSSLSDVGAEKLEFRDGMFCFIGVNRVIGKHVVVCGSTAFNMSLRVDGLDFEHFNCINVHVGWTPVGYILYLRASQSDSSIVGVLAR
jgi:hypothetical protein